MRIDTVEECYIEELKALYHAEHQRLRILPEMARVATAPELATLFIGQIGLVWTHLERLDIIFDGVKTEPLGKPNLKMASILADSLCIIRDEIPGCVKDASLIGAAHRIKHYGVISYESVRGHASVLGEHEAVVLLDRSLQDEIAIGWHLAVIGDAKLDKEGTLQTAGGQTM